MDRELEWCSASRYPDQNFSAPATITIVKCVSERSPVTSTRSNQSGARQVRPREVSMIEINQSVVPSRITGAHLILEFAEVIGRPPALPTEIDIQFSDVELDEWAKYIWRDYEFISLPSFFSFFFFFSSFSLYLPAWGHNSILFSIFFLSTPSISTLETFRLLFSLPFCSQPDQEKLARALRFESERL